MSVKLLDRRPVSFEKPADVDLFNFDELAKEASEVLGYDPLTLRIAEVEDEVLRMERARPFKEILAELDIKPFTQESVNKYKKETAERVEWAANHLLVRFFTWVFLTLLVACGASLIAALSAAIFIEIGGWVWTVVVGEAVACVLVLICFACAHESYGSPKATWERIAITQYAKLIPEFALYTAVQVKKRCSQATLYIDELRVDTIFHDPFLVVKDSEGNEYCLEVWNEPGFKQKRQK